MRRSSAFLVLPVVFAFACSDQPTGSTDAQSFDVPAVRLSHGPDGTATATATLRPVNNSGVWGVVAITDDGSKLMVTGLALGLDPANTALGYGSLFYDRASQLRGPEACEPGKNVGIAGPGFGSTHPLALTLAQMTIGSFPPGRVWEVAGDGRGGLDPVTPLEYVSVDRIGNVSIRDLRVDGPFGPGSGPAAVVACGKVTLN